MTPLKLEDLKAKDLKVIATNAGLTFDKMDNAETILKILSDAGITAIPVETPDKKDDNDAPEIKQDAADGEAPKKTKVTKVKPVVPGEFEVLSHITRNGQEYKIGSTITFDAVTDEVRSLVEDNIISQ